MRVFFCVVRGVQTIVNRLILVGFLLLGPSAASLAQSLTTACAIGAAACESSCGRFGKGDARVLACENYCKAHCSTDAQPSASPDGQSAPEIRTYSKKGDALRERELNGKMLEAIAGGDLRNIRRLVEMKNGLNPTYVYAFDFNPATRQYEGRAVKLRLSDLFSDTVTVRRDDAGLDKVLALLVELGLDVKATLAQPVAADAAPSAVSQARTAWGPSLKFMERAKDKDARLRAFEIALQNGLQPNDDVSDWLFDELPQVCGRDRSQFAIQVVDLLVKYLGTSLQDDFWRGGERGPETVSDVLDRLMSPGKNPRSDFERSQFAMMDAVWENCSPLSRRVNRYLTQGN